MDVRVILELLKLALEVGVPAVMKVVENWNKDRISFEDLENLKKLVKKPGEYRTTVVSASKK